MSAHAAFFGVLTHIDPLIYFKCESHDAWQHREYVVKRDVFVKKYVMGLDRQIFQELPIFVPDILGSKEKVEGPEKEDSEIEHPAEVDAKTLTTEKNDKILEEWHSEKWTELCIRFIDAARTHKWCIVQLYDSYPYWRVFTYREVTEIRYDSQDQPINCDVKWAKHLPRAAGYNLHEETLNFVTAKKEDIDEKGNAISQALFINLGSDLDERIEGTDIENVWSLAVYLRYIILDIVKNSAGSSGFYWLTWGSQVKDAMKAEVQDLFEKANTGNMVAATENVIKNMEAMFMAHPEFPVEALDKILKIFSGACDLPLLYFNGEKESGGIFEENASGRAQVNNKMKSIFGKFKLPILKLVEMRWGITCDDVFPNIEEIEDEEQYEEDIVEQREGATGGNGAANKKEVSVKN